DGERGIVQYRGQQIQDLYRDREFEDMVYLFVWGHLPSPSQKSKLRRAFATAARDIPPGVKEAIQAFPPDTTPVPMILAGLCAYMGSDSTKLPTYMGGNIYHNSLPLVDTGIVRTLAAYSVVIGLATSHRYRKKFTPADPDGSWLSNLLLMMGFVDPKTGKPNSIHVAAIQRTWVLSADHGATNSTSAMLLTASTLADPLSCLISAISAGYGPLHFGATEVAYKVIKGIGSVDRVPALIDSVKRGEQRLFGYGHRIYKTVDPRVAFAKQILEDLKTKSELLDVAKEIDRIASTDDYFIKRNLSANADLYGVFIFIALDFPPELVPVMMMASRSPGLMAHWREAMTSADLATAADLYWPNARFSAANIKAVKFVSMINGEI
ncbi:MAG: hypothetical protein Q9214_006235, partial [Letrouitia sp. 1 TL-2023]